VTPAPAVAPVSVHHKKKHHAPVHHNTVKHPAVHSKTVKHTVKHTLTHPKGASFKQSAKAHKAKPAVVVHKVEHKKPAQH
jgi:hypothetical protein